MVFVRLFCIHQYDIIIYHPMTHNVCFYWKGLWDGEFTQIVSLACEEEFGKWKAKNPYRVHTQAKRNPNSGAIPWCPIRCRAVKDHFGPRLLLCCPETMFAGHIQSKRDIFFCVEFTRRMPVEMSEYCCSLFVVSARFSRVAVTPILPTCWAPPL